MACSALAPYFSLLAALFALGAAPRVALAQPITTGGGFDARLFRPAVDSRGQFAVNGTDILGAWDLAFGLVVDYARDLARLGAPPAASAAPRALVTNLFTGTLFANVGIANWLTVGASFPVHLADGPGGDSLNVSGYAAPASGWGFQGAGDLGFAVKLRLLRAERTRFGLAVILQLGIPLGPNARYFAGEPAASLWPSVAFEWRPHRVFRLDLNAGYRHVFGAGSTLMSQATGAPIAYGPPLTAGLGASVRVLPAVDLVAEAYTAGYTNALGDARAWPLEAVGGVKVFVQRNSYLLLGAGGRVPIADAPGAATFRGFVGFIFEPSIGDADGDGYRDDADRCPSQPEDFDLFDDADGCPDPDNDRDGVLDVNDQCPNVPEDRDGDHDGDGCPESRGGDRDGDLIDDAADQCPDAPEDRDGHRDQDGCEDPDNDDDGNLDVTDLCPNAAEDRDRFEDDDGCPDPDNDRDRIPDTRDRCPDEPETYNGNDDDDGCRDEGDIVLEDGDIRLLRPINFETNSARIRADSVHIVESIARVLANHPEIELIEIQGHADERGDEDHNLRLTIDRAASVRQALVDRGIAPARLHSAGYGERCRAGYPAAPGAAPQNAACQQRDAPRWCHSERAWRRDRRVILMILRTHDGPLRVRVACDAAEDLIPEADRLYHTSDPAAAVSPARR